MPLRIKDLLVCEFFLWSYLKIKVYHSKPKNLDESRERITEEVQMKTQPTLERVLNSVYERLEQCWLVQGYHLRNVIFKEIIKWDKIAGHNQQFSKLLAVKD